MGHIIKAILLTLNVAHTLCSSASLYGNYDLKVAGVFDCKGPRHKDCAQFKCAVLPGGHVITVSLHVYEDALLDVFRILGYKVNFKKKAAPFVDMKVEKPCDQPVLRGNFHIGTSNDDKICIVKKGMYNYTVNALEISRKLWLDSFFYGDFMFKATLYGPKCNIGCNFVNVTYFPKSSP